MSDTYLSIWKGELKRCVTMREIAQEVASKHGCSLEEFKGARALHSIAHPRQEAMWRMREELGKSWGEIARFFNRDHTTIIHGYRAHQRRLEAA